MRTPEQLRHEDLMVALTHLYSLLPLIEKHNVPLKGLERTLNVVIQEDRARLKEIKNKAYAFSLFNQRK